MILVKILSESKELPSYETKGSAGMDLKAYIKEPVSLKPGERKLINTGVRIELPIGYEAQIRARSGLSIKHGIGLVNGIGTIDSDYRGEIKIPLINMGEEDFQVNNGDRIAQMVVAKYETVKWEEVKGLSNTERAENGFGHTGIK